MTELSLAVIGTGYWGPNLVRNFHDLDVLEAICDSDPQKLEELQQQYPNVEYTEDYTRLLEQKDIDAVALATPASTHANLVEEALQANKHVYVEKPLAYSETRARELCDLAERQDKKLMVGHIMLYHPAIQRLFELIDDGELGKINYSYSTRVNLGLVRVDANVLWNLAVHDLAVVLEMYESRPVRVTASGQDFLQDDLEDVSFMTVYFSGGELAHFHASWLDPQKIRRLTVVGSEKMAVFDDMKQGQQLAIHDKSVEFTGTKNGIDPVQITPETVKGDTLLPSLDSVEPLFQECQHFLECIDQDQPPLTDGHHALKVIRILEAADRSQKNEGKSIEITSEMNSRGT